MACAPAPQADPAHAPYNRRWRAVSAGDVEAVLGRRDDDGKLHDIKTAALSCEGPTGDDGTVRYASELDVRYSGALGYAVRIRPVRDEGPAFDDPVVWA